MTPPPGQPINGQSPALFVACHPDDQTLTMGVDILRHARQDVHVLLLTKGEASGVINRLNGTSSNPSVWWGVHHDPAAEGYAPLSLADFTAARMREAGNAIRLLGDGITVHEGGLIDGQVTRVDAEAAILAVCDAIAPGVPVRLKAYGHTVDDHADHLAAGAAVHALGQADPVRFSDQRYYVLGSYWDDRRLSQVDRPVFVNPADAEMAARAVNARRAYGAWSPPYTLRSGTIRCRTCGLR
jgi:LmbE family N-acetylglucosaminyl deacetylase